jgi:hypothetical protein
MMARYKDIKNNFACRANKWKNRVVAESQQSKLKAHAGANHTDCV